VSAAVLAAQVVLLRVFAIETYHHFAQMAIGMALLGFGASGTALVLLEKKLRGALDIWFERLCVAFPFTLVLGAALAGRIPFEPTQLLWAPRQWVWLILTYGALTVPFLVAAGALGIALMGAGSRVGRIYAWNLFGSGLGSAIALAILAVSRPDHGLSWIVALSAAAGILVLLTGGRSRARNATAVALLAITALCIVTPPWGLSVTPYKGLPQVEAFPDARRVAEAWGPTGWVVGVESSAFRHAPGLSLGYAGSFATQVALFVDGETAGAATLGEPHDATLAFMEWLPSATAYASGSSDRVLVLGSGGGLEVLSALRHGAGAVTDVELVSSLVHLRSQVSGLEDARASTVVGDARSYVARTDDMFDLIILPVTGAMPATAAGVYSLGEDYLNTVQAYAGYLRRLSPNGTLVVTRWLRTPPRDNVRMILTAAAALRAEGHTDVGGSLAFVRSWATGTLLVRPSGFDVAELEALRRAARERRFDVDWPSGDDTAFNVIERPVFTEAIRASASGSDQVEAFAAAYPFRVSPPTDDRPYFGRFVRTRNAVSLLREDRGAWLPFAEWGTLALVATLIQSGLLALILVGLPAIVLRRRGERGSTGRAAAYFGALGFGYVFLEMGAIQRLGLLLGHPVYAASATLAALLTFSGVGAGLSDRLPARRLPGVCVSVAALAGLAALVSPFAAVVTSWPAALRIAAALAAVALPATLMGMPFPIGLRTLTTGGLGVGWAWAANGVASVVGASLAVLVAMEVGGRVLFVLAGGFYLSAAAVAWGSHRRSVVVDV